MTEKKERAAALERLIRKYQKSYYSGEAEISDGEFDLLWDELQSLAPDSPVLQKVGSGSEEEGDFPKAKHLIPMGSQEKAANPEEFRAWAEKLALPEMLVQYKLDGVSLELQYGNGKLIRAITRGDGIEGDEITANALRMNGVLAKLDTAFSGGVRGEVLMTREIWQKKYSGLANCRNAANGIKGRKDGLGCEDLRFLAYDASAAEDDNYFTGEDQKINWLARRGFEIPVTKTFASAEDIIAYRAEVAAERDRLPYDIDGLVVKDIITDMADLLLARPEKHIAFKFELETAFTVLRQVEWSESGATYTPIGIVDEVRLAGTRVKRASLNNPGMIRAMGLKIGSVVSVVKRGEIIPKIEGLAPEGALPAERLPPEEQDIELPVRCGVCGAELVDAGTRLFCPNVDCPKRLLHRLEKWISVLNIQDLGEKLIRQLFDKGRVRQIHDLYTLSAEELASYERMGERSAAKVVRHIQAKRELSLAAFIAGFDFEGVAKTTMEKVTAAGFNTLEKLRAASLAELAKVRDVGEITAAVIIDGLRETAAEMDAVLAEGVKLLQQEHSLPLRGLSFCFTGELSTMKRKQAKDQIEALGAQEKSSVTKDLSYLVTNDPGSGSGKNKKAHELGIPVINEEQFLTLLADPKKFLDQQKNDDPVLELWN
jgi:DNA ligase (NAD+)